MVRCKVPSGLIALTGILLPSPPLPLPVVEEASEPGVNIEAEVDLEDNQQQQQDHPQNALTKPAIAVPPGRPLEAGKGNASAADASWVAALKVHRTG
ncbi:MAG: hypothetical protein L6R36_001310 [Xanthoria steineri]|nr:MAG: hypothetical protein L6R36_001310 [Xanthoria steineri]